eukprot:scaffold23294_cov35-Tisochrysis_lutea.AAC.1
MMSTSGGEAGQAQARAGRKRNINDTTAWIGWEKKDSHAKDQVTLVELHQHMERKHKRGEQRQQGRIHTRGNTSCQAKI